MVSISIRPSRHSYECIKRKKEFVVNLPSEQMVREVDACGILSGKETDKFGAMGWKAVAADKVTPPLIDQCPAQMECRVKQIIPLGSHDLFLGEIVALHVKEEFLKESGQIDINKILPLAYCPGSREYWSLGKRLGHHGFTKGKP
jgi:flavin reductase (DIM6/NTAB) family NADH-FMN oxidoreductase RutF